MSAGSAQKSWIGTIAQGSLLLHKLFLTSHKGAYPATAVLCKDIVSWQASYSCKHVLLHELAEVLYSNCALYKSVCAG